MSFKFNVRFAAIFSRNQLFREFHFSGPFKFGKILRMGENDSPIYKQKSITAYREVAIVDSNDQHVEICQYRSFVRRTPLRNSIDTVS